jgi:hypothetical protein
MQGLGFRENECIRFHGKTAPASKRSRLALFDLASLAPLRFSPLSALWSPCEIIFLRVLRAFVVQFFRERVSERVLDLGTGIDSEKP